MKLRIRFSKLGKVRFTSHRDVARMWERAFRRTRVALAYTGGFSPRPKISFGLALPTGHESLAEYLDVELEPQRPTLDGASDLSSHEDASEGLWGELAGAGVELHGLAHTLSDALPVGVDATGVVILDPGSPSLQEEVTSCTWTVQVPALSSTGAEALAAAALAADSLVVTRTRKGREVTDDLRQALVSVTAFETAEGPAVQCELLTQPRGVRPGELFAALDAHLELGRVCRMHQWIERGGARYEPLDAPRAPLAQELQAS